MRIVEYSPSESLTRMPFAGMRVVKSDVRSAEEGMAEIERLLRDYPVIGYDQEKDYHWGRSKTPISRAIVYRLEA